VVVVGDIADELVDKIAERARNLHTGDGTRGTDMGPLVTSEHRDKVAGYIDTGENEVARVVVDSRKGEFDAEGNGFFVGPTLFDHVNTDMTIYREELFGPVLSALRVDTYDQALELLNASPYGNGTAIFTKDGGAARRFENEVE